ncbi:DUF4233 domain-containing protein [Asanoa sp. WMMD1127]|uniref:DUF4233 domain-containing protein n=1 Tax=Asanoa sp. WMMD1127 TaxID=3016107 RepID=UPI0024169AA6|nr:DUF4233 domain-containing protein [Asanoa sp. WMMD1127]MDG4827678.1 DUF4233 domain-containing protein [Asanoa sp. WMMD1127]
MTDETRHEPAPPTQRPNGDAEAPRDADDAGASPTGGYGASAGSPAAANTASPAVGQVAGADGAGSSAAAHGAGADGVDVGPSAGGPAGGAGSGDDGLPPGYRRSGLRNPVAAVRGMGAAALGLQGVVLLLAIQPIRVLGDGAGAAAVWTLVGLVIACFVLCGMLRRAWAWPAGTAVQVALLVGGFLHWTLFALGLIFGLVWLYVLHVRRSILG